MYQDSGRCCSVAFQKLIPREVFGGCVHERAGAGQERCKSSQKVTVIDVFSKNLGVEGEKYIVGVTRHC